MQTFPLSLPGKQKNRAFPGTGIILLPGKKRPSINGSFNGFFVKENKELGLAFIN